MWNEKNKSALCSRNALQWSATPLSPTVYGSSRRRATSATCWSRLRLMWRTRPCSRCSITFSRLASSCTSSTTRQVTRSAFTFRLATKGERQTSIVGSELRTQTSLTYKPSINIKIVTRSRRARASQADQSQLWWRHQGVHIWRARVLRKHRARRQIPEHAGETGYHLPHLASNTKSRGARLGRPCQSVTGSQIE